MNSGEIDLTSLGYNKKIWSLLITGTNLCLQQVIYGHPTVLHNSLLLVRVTPGPCNTYQFKVLKSFEILDFWNFDQSFKISKLC